MSAADLLDVGGGNALIEKHASQFAQKGISGAEIPEVLIKAIQEGKIVRYQGKGTIGRPTNSNARASF